MKALALTILTSAEGIYRIKATVGKRQCMYLGHRFINERAAMKTMWKIMQNGWLINPEHWDRKL